MSINNFYDMLNSINIDKFNILKMQKKSIKNQKDQSTLIESLKKLIKFASQGPQCQRQIFASFNRNDLQKILSNFEDENEILRKLSTKLIVLLLSKSNDNKEQFCKIFEILPLKGKIILNKFPKKICDNSTKMQEIILTLKNYEFKDEKIKPICYYYNSDNNQVTSVYQSDYAGESFIDPSQYLLMINIEQNKKNPMKQLFEMQSITTSRKSKFLKIGQQSLQLKSQIKNQLELKQNRDRKKMEYYQLKI